MKSKLPSDFSQFLSCGENKNRLIELLFEVIKNERKEVLEILRCDELVLSRKRECKLLTHFEEKAYDQLLSIQEAADTKTIAQAVEILHQDIENKAVIMSPSGETDILVLSAALLYNFKEHVVIDNGYSQSRKCIDLRSLQSSECKYSAMLGLHAFTGNDYLSSFFRKRKERCWKLMQKYEEFEVCFTNLGSKPNLSEELFESLVEYTALLYGVKSKSINEACWKIFEKRHKKHNKIINLSLLPPWESVLRLHSKRANAVVYLWRKASNPTFDFPSLTENEWTTTCDIEWIEETFPVEVEEFITSDKDNGENEYDYGSDVESSDGEDYNDVF